MPEKEQPHLFALLQDGNAKVVKAMHIAFKPNMLAVAAEVEGIFWKWQLLRTA